MIKIFRLYRFLFARKFFFGFNKLLYGLSLRGLGILNYENDIVSGEWYFLRKILNGRDNFTVFDVGGNVGNYSIKIMQLEPTSNVYSFEPHPMTFLKLAAAAQQFGFKAFNLGCGDVNFKLKLCDYANNDGSAHASLYKEVIEKIHKAKSKELSNEK